MDLGGDRKDLECGLKEIVEKSLFFELKELNRTTPLNNFH